jgi:hypothetical protein
VVWNESLNIVGTPRWRKCLERKSRPKGKTIALEVTEPSLLHFNEFSLKSQSACSEFSPLGTWWRKQNNAVQLLWSVLVVLGWGRKWPKVGKFSGNFFVK